MFVLLVLALDDLHLRLHRPLVEHGAHQVRHEPAVQYSTVQYSTVQYWAHQVRHEPVQRVQEVLLGDVEVEVGVGGGSEGIVAASLETEEMTEALVWK